MIPFFAQTQKDLDALMRGEIVEMALIDFTKPSPMGWTHNPREIKKALKEAMKPMAKTGLNTAALFDRPMPMSGSPRILGFVKDPDVNLATGVLSGIVKLTDTGISLLRLKQWRISVSLRVDSKTIPVYVHQFGNFYVDVENQSYQVNPLLAR